MRRGRLLLAMNLKSGMKRKALLHTVVTDVSPHLFLFVRLHKLLESIEHVHTFE
jgi:hypothetical protein